MVGPEHIDTSGGYFQLGNVFFAMNRVENALAMYDKVGSIPTMANLLLALLWLYLLRTMYFQGGGHLVQVPCLRARRQG